MISPSKWVRCYHLIDACRFFLNNSFPGLTKSLQFDQWTKLDKFVNWRSWLTSWNLENFPVSFSVSKLKEIGGIYTPNLPVHFKIYLFLIKTLHVLPFNLIFRYRSACCVISQLQAFRCLPFQSPCTFPRNPFVKEDSDLFCQSDLKFDFITQYSL